MVTNGKTKERVSSTNWSVYVLRLRENKFYIGVSVDVDKRYKQHTEMGKDSASFCNKYGIECLWEIIDTGKTKLNEAMVIEDEIALKYLKKYGISNVRGGRFLGNNQTIERKLKFK